jgi:alkanesulfonate monooxygenase SsuD/methylene tetrahydromethanopterin reductase-like flavin-dependent oxidoreductase (luciferase family)
MARAAEQVGFDSIWLGDHLLYRDDDAPERGPWEVWTLLAGLASATRRVTLGPLVACTAFHPPGLIAKMAATVDEISDGRLVLGLGAGWNQPEFQAFGLPYDHRVSRFEEAFGIIRRLVDGQHVTLAGRHHHVHDAVILPRRARHIPLMIGSNGPRVLGITLPHVDWWNTWYTDYGNTPDGFAVLNQTISVAAAAARRDPAAVRRSACVHVRLDAGTRERPVEGDVPPIEGDPARIASSLRHLAEAGADEAILVVDPITEQSIRTLGESLALLDQ